MWPTILFGSFGSFQTAPLPCNNPKSSSASSTCCAILVAAPLGIVFSNFFFSPSKKEEKQKLIADSASGHGWECPRLLPSVGPGLLEPGIA